MTVSTGFILVIMTGYTDTRCQLIFVTCMQALLSLGLMGGIYDNQMTVEQIGIKTFLVIGVFFINSLLIGIL